MIPPSREENAQKLADNKAAIVQAYRDQNWELTKLLTNEREGLKHERQRGCEVCGEAITKKSGGFCRIHNPKLLCNQARHWLSGPVGAPEKKTRKKRERRITKWQRDICTVYIELEDLKETAKRFSIGYHAASQAVTRLRSILGLKTVIGLAKHAIRNGWLK